MRRRVVAMAKVGIHPGHPHGSGSGGTGLGNVRGDDWRKLVFYVETLGNTMEIEVSDEAFASHDVGFEVICKGSFEFYNGVAKFTAAQVEM